MLEERYNEESAILEEGINPVGGKLLFNANTFFCFRKKYMVAGHMSEHTLYNMCLHCKKKKKKKTVH